MISHTHSLSTVAIFRRDSKGSEKNQEMMCSRRRSLLSLEGVERRELREEGRLDEVRVSYDFLYSFAVFWKFM